MPCAPASCSAAVSLAKPGASPPDSDRPAAASSPPDHAPLRKDEFMSHLADIDIIIKDITALEKAVEELGAEFRRGQTRYEWFGESIGDYPLPEGMTKVDLGKCTHAIHLPGCHY